MKWPAVALFAVLLLCTTVLVWKGAISSHAFTAVGGAILGYLLPRSGPIDLSFRKLRARDIFEQDEIPTRKDLSDVARTTAMPAKRREDL